MNEEHRNALERSLHDICQDLDAEDVLPFLRSKGIFKEGQIQEIMKITRKSMQNMQLVDFIKAAGPSAFQEFINALQTCNKEHLVEKILAHLPSSSIQLLTSPKMNTTGRNSARATCNTEMTSKRLLQTTHSIIKIKKKKKFSQTPSTSSANSSQSNTEDWQQKLETAQQTLKEMYETRFRKVYPFSLPFTFDIENTWVSLALKEEKKDSQTTEDHAELLKKAFGKVKMLIIEGDPATGKTSLMRRLAYEWANGKQELQHYGLVLYAEFREVHEKTFKSIADLALGGLEKHVDGEDFEILRFLLNDKQFCQQKHILLLLDGYDESSLEKQCSEFSSYIKEKTIKKPLFFNTVITTRKGYLSNLRGRKGRFLFAEVLGFTTKQQKEKYICNHFLSSEIDNKQNTAAVHSLLNNNENLNKLAETPLFLTFICLVHERIVDGTLLELYCSIIWWLIDRHQQDFPDRDIPALFGFENGLGDKFETIQDHYLHFPQLLCLGKMALLKLKENVFKPPDYAQFNLQPIIEQIGLLRKERMHNNSFKIVTSFFFPHRTIQEFLAAFYCFCSNDPTSEWLLPDSKLNTAAKSSRNPSGMNEFERFLLRIALSNNMPVKAEKRKYYFDRVTDIKYIITFDEFHTTAGYNNELLNWFLSQCTNVQDITFDDTFTVFRRAIPKSNDTSIFTESAITLKTFNPSLISISDLTKLQALEFLACTFEANSQLSFTSCPTLKHLKLHGCETKSSLFSGIATLQAIDTAEFSSCTFDLATWISILGQIKSSSVKCLTLSADFFVGKTYPEFWHHLKKCERIKQIHVRDFYTSNETVPILIHDEEETTKNLAQAAEKLPGLTSITISTEDLLDNYEVSSLPFSDSSKEEIERAGQERNPYFSIKYLKYTEPVNRNGESFKTCKNCI